jgi:hypothetical protein
MPVELFHPIIQACEQGSEFHLVHPIYDLMRRHKMKLKTETFRNMINLCVKMKDVSHYAGHLLCLGII